MAPSPIDRLRAIMVRLRDPETGCPWDKVQTFASIAPHTLEEAYEVVDAIERGTTADLRDELGDLLFQVVYHACLAEEQGLFTFDDVATAMADKLVRRHPHVFGDEAVRDAQAQTQAWERQKAAERAARAAASGQAPSVLDGVTQALPALSRAQKLGQRVAPVGFDWPTPAAVFEKLDEEVRELQDELTAGSDPELVAGELGDMLFVVAQLARKLGQDPERALRLANAKFERRFRHVEAGLAARGQSPADATLDEMEELWADAKRRERSGKTALA
ncbi:nucleoside triphosphate pyrophosphohydrolase [Pararhodospirillum photometricum]|uniref:Nucleoside triphosphate pyrophosphohydrolase n=1 Tax=Pararhodospirillum photometricum DSM 122 TaxID=1150469 RepID=H6SSF7_PARPM|nr:nucleoside triphosphate pyrophosphohydrolase [Pararhodospirillum photometricum]CCG07836.1 MazG [Pararhodospirillum photometricum DSM 122]